MDLPLHRNTPVRTNGTRTTRSSCTNILRELNRTAALPEHSKQPSYPLQDRLGRLSIDRHRHPAHSRRNHSLPLLLQPPLSPGRLQPLRKVQVPGRGHPQSMDRALPHGRQPAIRRRWTVKVVRLRLLALNSTPMFQQHMQRSAACRQHHINRQRNPLLCKSRGTAVLPLQP